MYTLLVTAPEFAEITRFVAMDLGVEGLFKAIGEIVGIPWEELTQPLYYKVDERAPNLRFADHDPVPPPLPPPPPDALPPPPTGGNGPAPIAPADALALTLPQLLDTAGKVYLIAEL